MTFWAVVLLLGTVAAALSWRASRRAFDGGHGEDGRWEDERWEAVGPHESMLGRRGARR